MHKKRGGEKLRTEILSYSICSLKKLGPKFLEINFMTLYNCKSFICMYIIVMSRVYIRPNINTQIHYCVCAYFFKCVFDYIRNFPVESYCII